MSAAPYTVSGTPWAFEMWTAASGRNCTNAAPISTPQSEPRPATTAPTRIVSDSLAGNEFGSAKATAITSSDPATPAYAALIANASVLYAAMFTPEEVAASSLSRTALKARPGAPRNSNQATTSRTRASAHVR